MDLWLLLSLFIFLPPPYSFLSRSILLLNVLSNETKIVLPKNSAFRGSCSNEITNYWEIVFLLLLAFCSEMPNLILHCPGNSFVNCVFSLYPPA